MNDKRAMYILVVFCILFLTLIGYTTYIEVQYGKEYSESAYNARNTAKDQTIIRGGIYDRNMVSLAYSEDVDGNIVRRYPFNNLYAHVVGYVSPDYTSRTLIEQKYNAELLGDTSINKVVNIKHTLESEKNRGNDVILTIDHEIFSGLKSLIKASLN